MTLTHVVVILNKLIRNGVINLFEIKNYLFSLYPLEILITPIEYCNLWKSYTFPPLSGWKKRAIFLYLLFISEFEALWCKFMKLNAFSRASSLGKSKIFDVSQSDKV